MLVRAGFIFSLTLLALGFGVGRMSAPEPSADEQVAGECVATIADAQLICTTAECVGDYHCPHAAPQRKASPRKAPSRVSEPSRRAAPRHHQHSASSRHEAAHAQQIVALVNRERARGAVCGNQRMRPAGPVQLDMQLTQAGQHHAQDMAWRNYFSHTGRDGRSPHQRIRATGHQARTTGENIAAGNATAEATMRQWMTSPGHCRNIMNPRYDRLGVGYATGGHYSHYWVQKFSGR
jgi:uncharacterized protein YkwD